MVTEEKNIHLKSLRTQVLNILIGQLLDKAHMFPGPNGFGFELNIHTLKTAIKDGLGLTSVEAEEVFSEVTEIFFNSRISIEVGGANNSFLLIKIVYQGREENAHPDSLPLSGHDLAEAHMARAYEGAPFGGGPPDDDVPF